MEETLEQVINKVDRARGTISPTEKYLTSIDGTWVYECPSCKKYAILSCNKYGRDKYCSQCGTKLYWDEVDK